MRRSHEDIRELVNARVADFLNGDASEYVLLASLKALGLDKDEQKFELWKAKVEKHKQEQVTCRQRT